jgi:hypothetical protein
MRWDRFFDDLEDQLASEWEAERAALETEAERLRVSRISLRERLLALVARDRDGAPLAFELADESVLTAEVTGVGADWVALQSTAARGGATLAPLGSIVVIGMPHADVLRSARPVLPVAGMIDRMTFGFVVRDLVRRRIAVAVAMMGGRVLAGTIDRAGADHLDIALHEAGLPRRADLVTGHRIVPFASIAWIRLEVGATLS